MSAGAPAILLTARLALAPLSGDDADEAYPAFADRDLYRLMVGSAPADAGALRERFTRLAAGSPDPGERWLNWLARRRDDSTLVGWHQATVAGETGDIAWVTFAGHRRAGYAREGAAAVLAWLRGIGVREVIAQADLRNAGSNATAAALGFVPDPGTIDESLRGEPTVDRRWRILLDAVR